MLEKITPIEASCKIAKTTKEVLPLTINSLDKAGSSIINIINTILTPFDLANLYTEHAKTKFANKLKNKLNNIPYENRCKPNLSTVGPIIDSLKYNLNEENLHDMYANLLAKSCNKDFSKDVLVVYAEIIKQLTSKEAYILKTYNILTCHLGICDIRFQKKFQNNLGNISDITLPPNNIIRLSNEGYDLLLHYLPLKGININYIQLSTMIDNWIRLNLVQIKNSYLLRENAYQDFYYDDFTKSLEQKELQNNYNKDYEIAHIIKTMYPTYLGENFYNICIKD